METVCGNLNDAIAIGSSAVRYADQIPLDITRRAIHRTNKRASHADSLHQAGLLQQACDVFQSAEAIQAEARPQYPWLFSINGTRYCDLLLSYVETKILEVSADRSSQSVYVDEVTRLSLEKVKGRTSRSLSMADERGWLLEQALDNWMLARVSLCATALNISPIHPAKLHIEIALKKIRDSGRAYLLPPILLTLAFVLYHDPSVPGGNSGYGISTPMAAIEEAETIATKFGTRLHLADCHLTKARLFSDREALGRAEELVMRLGYHRRNSEISSIRRLI